MSWSTTFGPDDAGVRAVRLLDHERGPRRGRARRRRGRRAGRPPLRPRRAPRWRPRRTREPPGSAARRPRAALRRSDRSDLRRTRCRAPGPTAPDSPGSRGPSGSPPATGRRRCVTRTATTGGTTWTGFGLVVALEQFGADRVGVDRLHEAGGGYPEPVPIVCARDHECLQELALTVTIASSTPPPVPRSSGAPYGSERTQDTHRRRLHRRRPRRDGLPAGPDPRPRRARIASPARRATSPPAPTMRALRSTRTPTPPAPRRVPTGDRPHPRPERAHAGRGAGAQHRRPRRRPGDRTAAARSASASSPSSVRSRPSSANRPSASCRRWSPSPPASATSPANRRLTPSNRRDSGPLRGPNSRRFDLGRAVGSNRARDSRRWCRCRPLPRGAGAAWFRPTRSSRSSTPPTTTSSTGCYVSPDLDSVTYTLAGASNVAQGWGLEGETFATLDALAPLRRAHLVPPRRQGPRHPPLPHRNACGPARRSRR